MQLGSRILRKLTVGHFAPTASAPGIETFAAWLYLNPGSAVALGVLLARHSGRILELTKAALRPFIPHLVCLRASDNPPS